MCSGGEEGGTVAGKNTHALQASKRPREGEADEGGQVPRGGEGGKRKKTFLIRPALLLPVGKEEEEEEEATPLPLLARGPQGKEERGHVRKKKIGNCCLFLRFTPQLNLDPS